MKIHAVNKIIPVNDINTVDAHVHVWVKFEEDISLKTDLEVDDFKLIESSLLNFRKNGGSLVIDCTPYGCGRDGSMLHEISQKTGVEIVCTTGFHRREYYLSDHEIWDLNLEDALAFFIEETKTGLKETLNRDIKVKAGIIKIPFLGVLDGAYETLTEAAILASIETEIPLLIHTERGLNVEWFSDYLEEKGIKPEKVVFCHVDKRPDIKFHEKLAEKGYYLEYDTFLREKYEPEKNTYKLIDSMVKSGYSDSIMVGSDIAGNAMWATVNEAIGYGGFIKMLQQRFLKNYSNPEISANILGGNAARFLSVRDG